MLFAVAATAFPCAGGCQLLSISGPGFLGGEYSCLFKRGMQRASAPAVGNAAGQIEHLAKVVRCIVPSWNFEAGNVQLILVKEGSGQLLAGPVQFRGNAEGEMFEFLKEWHPLNSNPSAGPASGGAILGFSTWGFDMASRWYRCVFTRRREGI